MTNLTMRDIDSPATRWSVRSVVAGGARQVEITSTTDFYVYTQYMEPGSSTDIGRCEFRASPENDRYQELVQFERGLQDLLSGFSRHQPLPRSEGLRELARRAVQQRQQHAETDLERWARSLADDVADLTD